MLQISFKVRSELGTSVLTDVVMSAVAVHVVPEVITEDRAGDLSGFSHCRFLASILFAVKKEKRLTRRGRGIPWERGSSRCGQSCLAPRRASRTWKLKVESVCLKSLSWTISCAMWWGLCLGLCVLMYFSVPFNPCACKPRSLTLGWSCSYVSFSFLPSSWTISCTRWLGLDIYAMSVSWSFCKYVSPLDGLVYMVPSGFCFGLRQFANISHHWMVSFMWSQVQVPGWWSLWYPLVLPPGI